MTNLKKELKQIQENAISMGLLSPDFENRVKMDRPPPQTPVFEPIEPQNPPEPTVKPNERLPEVKRAERVSCHSWMPRYALNEENRLILGGKAIITVSGKLYKALKIPSGHAIKEIPLYQDAKTGNRRVSMQVDSKRLNIRIHRLVAEVFIPNPQGYKTVIFKDGDQSNPHKDNLEWGFIKRERVKYKRTAQSLTEEQLADIMLMFEEGMTRKAIAAELQLKYGTVCAVVRRFKHD